MADLIDTQRLFAQRISRFVVNIKKKGKNSLYLEFLQTGLEILAQLWSDYRQGDAAVRDAALKDAKLKESRYFTEDEYDKTQFEYQAQVKSLEAMISQYNDAATVTKSATSNSTAVETSSTRSCAALTTSSLPTFEGHYKDWPAFRDLFTSLVASDPSLSSLERLRYLKDCVHGDAATVFKNVETESTNFQVAWEKLGHIYSNLRLWAQAPSNALVDMMHRPIPGLPDDQTWPLLGWRPKQEGICLNYELSTVTYGRACTPYLTTRCLQQLAKMEEQLYPIGSCSIRRVSDRDDARSGADALSETRPKQPDRLDLRMAGGFLRRSLTSHSRSLPADLSISVLKGGSEWDAPMLRCVFDNNGLLSSSDCCRTTDSSSLWNSGFPELAMLGTYLRPTSSLARLWVEAAPNRCLQGGTQPLLATLRQECCIFIGVQSECWILLMAGGFPHRPGTSTCRSLLDGLSTSALKGVGGWDTLSTHFVFSHNELSSSDCCQITASPFRWNSEFPELTVLGGTYLPYVYPLAKLWVEAAHNRCLHGGTKLPLATLRQDHLILSCLSLECCTLMAGGFPRSTWASNSRSPLDGHSTSELKGDGGWDTLILHSSFGNNWLFLSERCLIIATISLLNSTFPELAVLGGTSLLYVSPQAKLWVEAAHNRRLHGGTQLPLATLRQERWILSGLQVVKSCIDRCTVWLLLKGQTAQPTIERVPISSNHVSAYRSGDYYDAPTHLRSRQDRGQLNSRESNSWNSNLPSSPHFGEILKAAVNSARHHLRRIIGEHLRSFEELTTLLTGIGACCVSKLLLTLTDPEDPAALTPGHISIGEPFTAISEPSLDEPPVSRSYPLYLVLVAAVRPLASALSLPVHQLTPRLAPEDEEKDPGGTSEAGLTRGSPDASL